MDKLKDLSEEWNEEDSKRKALKEARDSLGRIHKITTLAEES